MKILTICNPVIGDIFPVSERVAAIFQLWSNGVFMEKCDALSAGPYTYTTAVI
jgi:hypothetical protein